MRTRDVGLQGQRVGWSANGGCAGIARFDTGLLPVDVWTGLLPVDVWVTTS
ncbi:MAG: hypothetical protein QOI41_2960 [Myxococcales bacterium]|nr:hypothetical protein [Myxococcales bacterium]